MSNIIRQWNGRTIRIQQNRYVSLTDMAQATGKLFADWRRLKSTTSYLEKLSSVMGIPITDLTQVNQGGVPELQGAWGHPKVGIRFAQWCSDDFAVQVDCWMDELLTTGKVELGQPRQIEPLRREQQLDALKMLFSLNERLPDDRTTITLKAHLTNLVEASQQSEPVPPMLTVTEVLEMEGISIPSGKDSVLGRKVAKAFREIYGAEPTATAKHIGTGHRTANIKLYPQEFFERIVAIASEYFA